MKKTDKLSKFDRPQLKSKIGYTRPGSMTILQAPSRIKNTLFYPNGEVKREKKPD
jgi:hypothetical protein